MFEAPKGWCYTLCIYSHKQYVVFSSNLENFYQASILELEWTFEINRSFSFIYQMRKLRVIKVVYVAYLII